jgi:hypothetical protein
MNAFSDMLTNDYEKLSAKWINIKENNRGEICSTHGKEEMHIKV